MCEVCPCLYRYLLLPTLTAGIRDYTCCPYQTEKLQIGYAFVVKCLSTRNRVECAGVIDMHNFEKIQQVVRYDNGDAFPLKSIFHN